MKTMNGKYAVLIAFVICALAASTGASARPPAQPHTTPVEVNLEQRFVADTVKANGTRLYYVRGGEGPAVILLHGFPQDWSEWRHVMPRLADKFTVIAVDLRGVGGSKPTPGGYEAANLAEDVHQLVRKLDLAPVYIAGHDIGGHVAYAYARRYPQTLRGVMILETPVPGIAPWRQLITNPALWHIAFHQVPNLPEKLIAGQQAAYFRFFFQWGTTDPEAITATDVQRYANAYATPRNYGRRSSSTVPSRPI